MQPRTRKQLVTKTITVPENLQRACEDFNAGRFYESHEHLEEIWQYERGRVRDAYKGLIQIAAAFVSLRATTTRLRTVVRASPMWPAMRVPL